MDLMATEQRAPTGGGLLYRRLPFYLRLHRNGTAGVDVFSHDMNHIPGLLRTCFGYCCPQPSLVGVVLAQMSKCKARAVVVVPNTRSSWFPIIEGAGVHSVQIASKGEDSQFLRERHQYGASVYTFGRGGMRPVEVDVTRTHDYTRTTTHITGIRNTHALINERIYAQCGQ